jgi:hypothetical protein
VVHVRASPRGTADPNHGPNLQAVPTLQVSERSEMP